MNYKFPVISHLDQLKPYIENCTSIGLNSKDDYIVVNYLVADKEAFPDISEGDIATFRRECRGLIFNEDGKILRRAFHKFFNLGEREDLLFDKIDFSEPHIILDKVDGSMVTPLMSKGDLRFATKAGITDISRLAEDYVNRTPSKQYREFCTLPIIERYTPIFEYISRSNRVVIDYDTEDMILLAIRDNISGNYIDWNVQCDIAKRYNIPVVKVIHNSHGSIDNFVKHIYGCKDIEGVVVRFNSGHMLKIKTEWYVNIHRAKDACLHEKRVLSMILDDKLDDVIPFLPKEDVDHLLTYRDNVWKGIKDTVTETLARLNLFRHTGLSKKEYALKHAPLHDPILNSIIYKCWDNDNCVEEFLKSVIKKKLGSQTTVDKVRFLWGNHKWSFNLPMDDEQAM